MLHGGDPFGAHTGHSHPWHSLPGDVVDGNGMPEDWATSVAIPILKEKEIS